MVDTAFSDRRGPTVSAVDTVAAALYRDGVVEHQQALGRVWAAELAADIDAACAAAPYACAHGGGGGARRGYAEIHPEALRGFVALVDHPWVRAVSAAVLGPDYRIMAVGLDHRSSGSADQSWHRDCPSPRATRRERRLTSLAFDVACMDSAPHTGAFEVAVGTQWESGADFEHEMFPARSEYARYARLAVPQCPRAGDISARSPLAIHRTTQNHSDRRARPALVLSMGAPGVGNDGRHAMAVTRAFWLGLPPHVRQHMACPIVGALVPPAHGMAGAPGPVA
ncbi:phytanoyl-CoA dioxygenase family protein [Salinisphaera sp. RV14]|uniref:phytanoyl-CoA dioxygenase family protein n=1 Tax=unclassified Salinisphaera TaxID=2649847 RepID=UPI003F83894A